MELKPQVNKKQLPWWTWVVPLIIFQAGTQLSLAFQIQSPGSSLFYFPTCCALVLIFWWGPRILVSFYLNAALSAGFWGLSKWYFWPLYGMPETTYALLAWLFFIYQRKGEYWLPNTKQFITFLIWVLVCPLIIHKIFLESLFLILGDRPANLFFSVTLKTLLGDFISIVGLAIPILYFFSYRMQTLGLTLQAEPIPSPKFKAPNKPILFFAEVVAILLVLLLFSFILNFEKFWFIYCLLSLVAAIRFGFEAAILTNIYIYLITYILPFFFRSDYGFHDLDDLSLVNVYLGNSLLYVFALITGRVISDLRLADEKLHQKNTELEQANTELDHFVYSASHDLSAPLKSIRGLVNISKLSNDPMEKQIYFSKIEASVLKLEQFIGEVLDYSRNKRLKVSRETILLQELISEILENLGYSEGFQTIKIDSSGIQVNKIKADKIRLKIILNNLLSNAIKFQKNYPEHDPTIQIFSTLQDDSIKIAIQDNGEGIKSELHDKIFNMFFRATQSAKGSGLGLYIAKEAADKMGGRISVQSEYGKGSRFTIDIKQGEE
jgi:signal transduction histidine kinase